MHDIQYHYPTANNRLGSITATGINSSTYQYDALGNLVRDNAENLTVAWNSLGKVDSIVKNSATISSFRYSPTGQRQMKAVRGDTTFYIQDATGNVMCVYRLKNDTLTAMERYLYGSKRLGMLEQQVWIKAGGAARLQDTCTIGHRLYELTDHLGNVTTTLFDRKILIFNINEDTVYMPAVNTYTDYYPFGYPMSWRSFDMGGYRYFFNGQEADNEVFGEGALAGYEFRQYDTRLGRWWGIDRKAAKYPSLSPYQFCADNPIRMVDVDGSDFVVVIDNSGDNKTITIQMNIYTASKEAYKKLQPAVKEINSITKKVTIDGVEYTLNFVVNPIKPDPTVYQDYQKRQTRSANMIHNAHDLAKSDGFCGNTFMGSRVYNNEEEREDGTIGVTGGATFHGKSAIMNVWKGTSFINYPQLIAHEVLHMMGLDDAGGKYYSPGGRMEYVAKFSNNFYMNPISDDDIRNIVRYMLDNNGKYMEEGAQVKVEYINGSTPIESYSEIEVK